MKEKIMTTPFRKPNTEEIKELQIYEQELYNCSRNKLMKILARTYFIACNQHYTEDFQARGVLLHDTALDLAHERGWFLDREPIAYFK